MEAAFGANFAAVRIHESPEALSISAFAYTRGEHIHFAPGQYQPEHSAGQKRLGHELAHVLQQRFGRVPAPHGRSGLINQDPGLEIEADRLGHRVSRGESVVMPGRRSEANSQTPLSQQCPIQCGFFDRLFGSGSQQANEENQQLQRQVDAMNTANQQLQRQVEAVSAENQQLRDQMQQRQATAIQDAEQSVTSADISTGGVATRGVATLIGAENQRRYDVAADQVDRRNISGEGRRYRRYATGSAVGVGVGGAIEVGNDIRQGNPGQALAGGISTAGSILLARGSTPRNRTIGAGLMVGGELSRYMLQSQAARRRLEDARRLEEERRRLEEARRGNGQ
jgi:hypothetical protein